MTRLRTKPVRKRIALIDDHAATRVGLEHVLAPFEEFLVVASAETVPKALAVSTEIDIAILDLRLKDGSSVEQNVALLRSVGSAVLAYTAGEEPRLVGSAARLDIAALVRKSERIDLLIAALRDISLGAKWSALSWAASPESDAGLTEAALSARERQVLYEYASGKSADEVATTLFISRETVLEHIKRIRAKFLKAGRPAPTKVHLHQRAVEDGLL